jgi:hypothetical protein
MRIDLNAVGKVAGNLGNFLMGATEKGVRSLGRMDVPILGLGGSIGEGFVKHGLKMPTRMAGPGLTPGLTIQNKLTKAGMIGRTAGNAAMMGYVGPRSYQTLSDAMSTAKDANGARNPHYNEEYTKGRTKFVQEFMGGSNQMSPAKYRLLRDQNPQLMTAIRSIPKQEYIRMRREIVQGKDPSGAAMRLHSRLTDELAKIGDTESMKKIASGPIVLPGVAKTSGGQGRIVVLSPRKSKEGSSPSFDAYMFEANEEE